MLCGYSTPDSAAVKRMYMMEQSGKCFTRETRDDAAPECTRKAYESGAEQAVRGELSEIEFLPRDRDEFFRRRERRSLRRSPSEVIQGNERFERGAHFAENGRR
jgi:hypothetical protein